MSAGYWKRKLRIRNGASNEDNAIALTGRRGAWPVGPFVAFLDGPAGQAAGEGIAERNRRVYTPAAPGRSVPQ